MNILGSNIKLKLVSHAILKKEGSYDYGTGSYNYGTQTIIICANYPQSIQQSTLIHEIIEALDTMLELKLPHSKISQLETGIYQVLVSNGVDLKPLLKNK